MCPLDPSPCVAAVVRLSGRVHQHGSQISGDNGVKLETTRGFKPETRRQQKKPAWRVTESVRRAGRMRRTQLWIITMKKTIWRRFQTPIWAARTEVGGHLFCFGRSHAGRERGETRSLTPLLFPSSIRSVITRSIYGKHTASVENFVGVIKVSYYRGGVTEWLHLTNVINSHNLSLRDSSEVSYAAALKCSCWAYNRQIAVFSSGSFT